MANPYVSKVTPYMKGAKSGYQIADGRYGPLKTPNLRQGPIIADAQKDDTMAENFNGSPTRQMSDTGKVRK